jgi:uncharacterized protein (DUF1684 family)
MRTGSLITLSFVFLALQAETPLPYPQQIAKFRADREAEIKKEWLTLVGLYWLKEDDNKIGSNPSSDVPLPSFAPGFVGTFSLKNGKVYFRPSSPGVLKLENGGTAGATEVKEEVFTTGTVNFFLIRRGERVGVRVKDSASPALKEFSHLKWFATDPSWKVTAKFTPWDKPHKLTYDTVIPGLREDFESPGYVTFRRNNQDYKIEPVEEDGQYFYVFRDTTSGKATYPAARYLYSEPQKNGSVVLDFNKAHNPPCAFTNFATCPLPPPQNRLKTDIAAGELDEHLHDAR